jgi:hypothetical protein
MVHEWTQFGLELRTDAGGYRVIVDLEQGRSAAMCADDLSVRAAARCRARSVSHFTTLSTARLRHGFPTPRPVETRPSRHVTR